MSYRVRLGKISKEAAEPLRSMSQKETEEYYSTRSDSLCQPIDHVELYEIGKSFHSEVGRTPFYSFNLDDEEFSILTKEGLRALILEYEESVKSYYKDTLTPIQNTLLNINKNNSDYKANTISLVLTRDKFSTLLYLLNSLNFEWVQKRTILQFDNMQDGEMTTSWRMEYAIFNLMYIYKTFNFDNDYLIYSGW